MILYLILFIIISVIAYFSLSSKQHEEKKISNKKVIEEDLKKTAEV